MGRGGREGGGPELSSLTLCESKQKSVARVGRRRREFGDHDRAANLRLPAGHTLSKASSG